MFQNNSADGIGYIKLGNRVVPREFLSSIEGNFQASEGEVLVEGWNLSTATYDEVSLDVTSQDSNPIGLLFNHDGTKMYITGYTTNTVYEYDLSTAWDLSTASYQRSTGAFLSTSTNSRFNSDGTKLFVITASTNIVNQFSLSTAYDVSSQSSDGVTFDYTSIKSGMTATALFFSQDGTKMYAMGIADDTIYQVTLSTPWDLTTASDSGKSFTVSPQDGTCYGFFIKSDGTKLYVNGVNTDSVYQYTLSTPWDISSASYDEVVKDVSGESSQPQDIAFNSDGTKMYMVGNAPSSTRVVFQYTLTD